MCVCVCVWKVLSNHVFVFISFHFLSARFMQDKRIMDALGVIMNIDLSAHSSKCVVQWSLSDPNTLCLGAEEKVS